MTYNTECVLQACDQWLFPWQQQNNHVSWKKHSSVWWKWFLVSDWVKQIMLVQGLWSGESTDVGVRKVRVWAVLQAATFSPFSQSLRVLDLVSSPSLTFWVQNLKSLVLERCGLETQYCTRKHDSMAEFCLKLHQGRGLIRLSQERGCRCWLSTGHSLHWLSFPRKKNNRDSRKRCSRYPPHWLVSEEKKGQLRTLLSVPTTLTCFQGKEQEK